MGLPNHDVDFLLGCVASEPQFAISLCRTRLECSCSPSFVLISQDDPGTIRTFANSSRHLANPRFVEVIVRSQKRFEALRDFTVEGALAELDRQTQERKDRGVADVQPTGVRSPARHGSIDGIRSPTSARSSTQLEHVPEHGRFAIGDDDDDDNDDDHEDDDEMRRSSTSLSAVRSSSASLVEDAMPMQSRSMSEKARGKQPVGQGSFSRSTSRNTSTASLPALNTLQANSAAPNLPLMQFRPTQEWVSYKTTSQSRAQVL